MNALKKLREKNNIKQEELASLIGVSPANYSKKEAGLIRFSLVEAQLIAKYFDLTIEDIFFNNNVSKNETQAI